MKYITPCFSEDCGLCINCCKNNNDYDKEISKKENIRRAEDIYKFMDYEYISEISNNYNINIKKWCKEVGFETPKEIGGCKKIIKKFKPNSIDPIIFNLVEEYHDYLCDNILCKVIYLNNKNKINYHSIPIYKNDNIKLCGYCITNKNKEDF